jgi:pyrroline-5-carboxylate reductase
MQTFTVGFIGAGNMASAIIKGTINSRVIDVQNVCVYDIDSAKTAALQAALGVRIANGLSELVSQSDILLLAVKPNVLGAVLEDIRSILDNKAVVSIAAGWSGDKIRSVIGADKRVLRLMPNTPLLVGAGMTVFETPYTLTDDEFAFVENMFASLGLVEQAAQKQMDVVTAVSGSGPAYAFMFIEALADAGVLCGLPRAQAVKLAAQTLLGSAKMVLETGSHPGALKDAVCSPGGTTIEAVKKLEECGFRGAIIKAAEQCAIKSQMLGK